MISIKDFTARLGNQLFQLCNAIAYAKRYKSSVAFPAWKYASIFKGNFAPLRDTDMQKILWNEPNFGYNEIPVGANLLGGYYQSEKYFLDYESEIRDMLSFKDEILDKVIGKNSEILSGESSKISMHLRRGDYLKWPNHHPVLDVSFFERASKEFPEDSIFIVFSDDPEWCKQNFPKGNYVVIEGQEDYEDLCLMTLCDHNCIANSTFSWWGAWLNPNPDKIVVAPKNWFGPAYSHFPTKDLYCEGWKII
jgi:hypothetical protein